MHELMQLMIEWILQFGGPILFLMLVLGIVGLPIPDETLLTLSGWLIANERLDPITTIAFAITGSICGITISYFLGKGTGGWLMNKFTGRLKFTEKKIAKVEEWYGRIGKWILLVCYFIPVVRHLAGYVAGSFKLELRKFMIFAYTGAILWSLTFLCLGYFLLVEVMPNISK